VPAASQTASSIATPAWYNLRHEGFDVGVRAGVEVRSLSVKVSTVNPHGKELMGNLGIPELLIILCIIILVFGANRLPEIGRGIGRGIKNFKEATKGGPEEAEKS
jgi:sec-independent protein translocase protein TatA